MKIFIKIALLCVGLLAFLFIMGVPERVTLSNIIMKAVAVVVVWVCGKTYYFILSDNERKEFDKERV